VDPELRPDILTRGRALPAALLALLACGAERDEPPPALPVAASQITILRFPVRGGTVLAHTPDSLAPLGWQSSGQMPAVARLLGYDHEQRIVYALDPRRRLVGLDLESGSGRSFLTGVTLAVAGPDGAVYSVDSAGALRRLLRRATTTFPARFDGPPRALFGAANGQVLAVSADSTPTLQLLAPERTGTPMVLPGAEVAATQWGELVATAHGSSVRLVRTADARTVREMRIGDLPVQMVFSPSGHRLYLLEPDGDLLVLDRFRGERVFTRRLPGPAREMRIDASGRWLLVRPAAEDSVWVLDLATDRPIRAIPTAWREDLPLVAGGVTLLVLRGDDVDAWNLSAIPPAPVARASGGARDLWLAIGWVPPERAREVLADQAAATARDLGLAPDMEAPVPGADAEFWLQVSSSQNPDWADDLANDLFLKGFPATVWPPSGPEERFRVVVGPYPSREEAEGAGRRVELPFFLVTRPRGP
jgi:hypothetical protein